METSKRTEFGSVRTVCGCGDCVTNCRFMPGYLIPSDLARMCPVSLDTPALSGAVLSWAESALLASPGAKVMVDGRVFNIPTLVPATKPDGSCVNLGADGLCGIHASAPFGCAFFDCGDDPRTELSARGLVEIAKAWRDDGPYAQLWRHLDAKSFEYVRRLTFKAVASVYRLDDKLVRAQVDGRGDFDVLVPRDAHHVDEIQKEAPCEDSRG